MATLSTVGRCGVGIARQGVLESQGNWAVVRCGPDHSKGQVKGKRWAGKAKWGTREGSVGNKAGKWCM